MSIKIITDSACDMTQSEAKELDITILPLIIRMEGEEYLDGVTISTDEFYKKLANPKGFPTTRPVHSAAFSIALKPMIENGDEVVIITISSKLSHTAANAVEAATKMGENIWVVDSLSATVGQNILVRYAVRLRDHGLAGHQIAQELERAKKHIHLLFRLDTLKYMMLGGRLSRVEALFGTLARAKPVLCLENGEVCFLDRPKGTRQSNIKLTEYMKKAGEIDFSMPVMMAYAGESKHLREYLDTSREFWAGREDSIPSAKIGATISTHGGLGVVAVAFFSSDYRIYHW